MNDKLQDALANLAAKLGTSAERLWPVLVHKQVLDWWSGMLTAFIALVATGTALYLSVKLTRKTDFDDSPVPVLLCLIFGFGTAVSIAYVFQFLSEVSMVIYPEASALRELRGLLR